MKCRQDRIHIWPIFAVFFGALGTGNIDPVVGEHSLEISFDGILPFFRDARVLDAYYRGSLFKDLVYFTLAPLVPMGSCLVLNECGHGCAQDLSWFDRQFPVVGIDPVQILWTVTVPSLLYYFQVVQLSSTL